MVSYATPFFIERLFYTCCTYRNTDSDYVLVPTETLTEAVRNLERDGWRLKVLGRVKNLGSCGQGIKNALKMTGEYDGPLIFFDVAENVVFYFWVC